MTNFNNVFVFKSNEREVIELVEDLNFCEPQSGKIGFGSDSQSCNRHEPITLANAPTGYAAIKLANGFQSNGLVEIERLYVDAPQCQKANANRKSTSAQMFSAPT